MVLKWHLSPYPTSLEDWTYKLWEASNDNPGAEVHTGNIPQPHNAVATITVNGLDKVVHILRMYGAVSGNLLHGPLTIEPYADTVVIFDPIRFKIGDGGPLTPAANSSTYTNAPILTGLLAKDFVIHRNNYGDLHPDIHYIIDSGTGSWALIAPDVFNEGEEFTIKMNPRILTTIVNDSVVGKWFGGFVNIAANTDYIASHLRKLIRFTAAVEYTFPALAAIPLNYGHCFNNYGVVAGDAKINFSNAPLLWVDGTTKANITLPAMCEACFTFDGVNWNVVYINQSTWQNILTPQPGQTIAVGETALGDIAAGDNGHIIVHNKNIAGDYQVFFSLKGTAATANRDNDIQVSWYHHATEKANKFHVMLGEPAGSGAQNLTLVWLIVKV